jgi:PD-(D/E)XK endonuclease
MRRFNGTWALVQVQGRTQIWVFGVLPSEGRRNVIPSPRCETYRLKAELQIFPEETEMRKNHTNIKGEIDLFAVYCQENEEVYFAPTLGALAEGRLRVSSTKNNQQQNVRWAEDFEFEAFLKNL